MSGCQPSGVAPTRGSTDEAAGPGAGQENHCHILVIFQHERALVCWRDFENALARAPTSSIVSGTFSQHRLPVLAQVDNGLWVEREQFCRTEVRGATITSNYQDLTVLQ